MKSIKEYKYINSDFTLQDILDQSLWYARCGILSVSLMSGFGLPWNYDSSRVKEWLNMLNSHKVERNMPENITLLRAVYKKGNPHYYSAYNGNRGDYKNFTWDDSTFEKVIIPSSQAYLIANEVELAKYFHKCYDNEPNHTVNHTEKAILAVLLINSAQLQSQFMSDYLRDMDGLFLSKEDVSENPYGDPVLKEAGESPTVSSQALAMKVFSMLSSTLDDYKYPLFKNSKLAAAFRLYADQLYSMFKESPEDTFGSRTRDLCNLISSAIEYYRTKPDNEVLEFVIRLSLELESRVDMSGNLTRFADESSLASNSSCFQAVKTLLEAFTATGLQKFQNAAALLYKKLDLLWDSNSNLYCLDNDDKFKYTLRDVGMVLGGLNSTRLFGDESYRDNASEKLAAFFDSAVNSSGIVQSFMSLPGEDDCEGHLLRNRREDKSIKNSSFSFRDIPKSIESGIAPVLAKKFSYKSKKRSFSINSSSFYSDYALLTINEFLGMNYPMIDSFYDKETLSRQPDMGISIPAGSSADVDVDAEDIPITNISTATQEILKEDVEEQIQAQ